MKASERDFIAGYGIDGRTEPVNPEPCEDHARLTSTVNRFTPGSGPSRIIVSVEVQGELTAVDDCQWGARVRTTGQTSLAVHWLSHGPTISDQFHRVDRLVTCRDRYLQPGGPLPQLHGVDSASSSRLAQVPVAKPGALALRDRFWCQRGRVPVLLDVRHRTRMTSVDVTPTPHNKWSPRLGRSNSLHRSAATSVGQSAD